MSMKNTFIIFLMLLLCSQISYAQQEYMVAGSVMDEKGETMVGVSVIVKDNPSKGVVTDLDGKFRISGLKKNDILQFSFIGYKRKNIKLPIQKNV